MMERLKEDILKVPQSQKNYGSPLICLPVPFSQLLLTDTHSRKSFTYSKVPQEPLKLTVLKLDDTYFEIEVAKNGTIAELKQAVKEAFKNSPLSASCKVSWSHVWGHFCLSHDGYKLLNDDDYIASYEIKDGDQLQFNRHVSINYNITRAESERECQGLNQKTLYLKCSKSTPQRSLRMKEVMRKNFGRKQNRRNVHHHGDNIECHEAHDKGSDDQCREDNDYDSMKEDEHKSVIMSRKYKFTHLFRGWLSYCKLKASDKTDQQTNSNSNSSKFTKSFRNIVQFYTNKGRLRKQNLK